MSLETFLNNRKKTEKDRVGGACIRIEVKLAKPTDSKFNELSYPRLLMEERRGRGEVGGDSSVIKIPSTQWDKASFLYFLYLSLP